MAALPLYVFGKGRASWGERDTHLLTLKADKVRYRRGDTARILVPSPFERAEALVSIERDGVLSVERKTLVGNAPTIEIPIDERFVPNAFVSVLLVRGRVAETPGDDGAPSYRVGVVELESDVSEHRLRVQIRPDAAEKRPGERLRVAFDVRDGAGRPQASELTVFAVDEGVLSLTGYQTPDPFSTMYALQGLSVWTADGRARLVRDLTAGEDEKGGTEGGGGGGEGLRKSFDAVAFYAPEVETDASGHAELDITLPDSLTRFRIMAVAVSKGAEFGSGEASVRTQKPLMLRPMLPRVFRAGDRVMAGTLVQTTSERAIEVEVSAEVSGLALKGPPTRRVRVSREQGAEVRFELVAQTAGSSRLRFTARAGRERDGFEVERPVLSPSVAEAVSTTGSTEGEVRERLGDLDAARSDVGGLELRVSTSALGALRDAAQALVDYEHACTEQLASKLIGLSSLYELSQLGAIEAQAKPEVQRRRAEQVLTLIERRQRSDGSFALWDVSRESGVRALDAFLTGYALIALDTAHRAGLTPESHAVHEGKAWLSRYMREENHDPHLGDADRVFALYALSRVGQLDLPYAKTFLERRDKLALFSRVELAAVLRSAGHDSDAVQALVAEITDKLRVTADEAHLEENLGDAYQALMVSDVRATAQLVLLLSDLSPEHPLLPRLTRWLSAARELDGTWGTTQRNAWGLLSLATYLKRVEGVPPSFTARAFVGERMLGKRSLEGRRASASFGLSMAELHKAGRDLVLQRDGSGRMHYTLRLTYAQKTLPDAALDRGLFVERAYTCFDPVALAQGKAMPQPCEHAKPADYVRVTLRVAVPATRRFVVIEDPLPAGLEPVSFGLQTEAQGARDALSAAMGPYDHEELRDDRAVFFVTQLEPGFYEYSYLARATTQGTFVVPPARVSEMYHPETFGRTAATQFAVRP
jgi:uncharacterized protein YfaS (alpha-2-macroglobulin family)